MFPESWRETSVENVILNLQPGFAQKPGEEDDGTTPQIRTHNITPDGEISLEGIKHIYASAKESARYTLMKGDVLFNNTNSEEWVGKSAVFDQDGEYVFSNHMTRLRVNPELIMPEYLATYLHLLWSMGYSKTRAKRWVSQAGIDSAALASFKILLPTLPEQKRIVDVLQQAKSIVQAKQSVNDQIDRLVQTAYWDHFNAWYSADGLVDPVRISDYVKDSQYGVSKAMEETGSHIVLRMNSITTSGWLNLTDFKYADLSPKDIEATTLKDGDLLFNRTNSRELVGKCALWRGSKGPFSFASYLVRLRLKDEMLPEYLWATLNSTYGKYRLYNAAKQAVSMANVSPTDLGRITVPLPPKNLQEKFTGLIKEIEQLRNKMLSKLDFFYELQSLVTQNALSGELTENWRDTNKKEIKAAAAVRDALLRERGVKLKTTAAEPSVPSTKAFESVSPARHWLTGELSEFQRQVLAAFIDYPEQPLIVEDENAFITFCDSDEVTERLQIFGEALNNRIRRALSQLGALGLIAQVTLPKLNDKTDEREYLKAFRPLREADFSRLSDIESIKRALKPQPEEQFHFLVHLDYETTERAGAGGMFQVLSIEDEEGKGFTHLVDQGIHYSSLDDLRNDIASALKVSLHQIELEEV
jgi:type I restriction enzyme S subunit